ncbi:MAG: DUF1330 domain-containing protein [Cyclobacteriaceae bacterium]|nr:DUF1330 domain-containing protein [Cyclobacteriaceae bacterium HetDA_MAG_MS6]
MKNVLLTGALLLAVTVLAQKSQNITFTKGKLIEVALLSVKEGKENQFYQEYFSQVMPVAVPYGAKPIASFATTRKVIGDNPAKVVVFFEWENLKEKRKFERNPEFLKLRNIRDNALQYLVQGYFQVDETKTIKLQDDKVYDFAALWIDPTNAPKLQEYFGAVMPEATKPKIGYTPIATLNSAGAKDQNWHPSLIAFAEWKGGSEAVDKLEKTKAFKDNVHLREAATSYKEVFHLKPLIQ